MDNLKTKSIGKERQSYMKKYTKYGKAARIILAVGCLSTVFGVAGAAQAGTGDGFFYDQDCTPSQWNTTSYNTPSGETRDRDGSEGWGVTKYDSQW